MTNNKNIRLVVPDETFNWYKNWVDKQPIQYYIPDDKEKHPCFAAFAMMSITELKKTNKKERKKYSYFYLPGRRLLKTSIGFAKGTIKSNKNLIDKWKKIIRKYYYLIGQRTYVHPPWDF